MIVQIDTSPVAATGLFIAPCWVAVLPIFCQFACSSFKNIHPFDFLRTAQ
jgi:hypothetical protein